MVGDYNNVDEVSDPEQHVDSLKHCHHSLELSPFGNLVIHASGVYKRCSRLDLLEAATINNSSKINIRSLWASFGRDTFVSILAKSKLG